MPQIVVENNYRIEITSEECQFGWKAKAEARPLDGDPAVDPITTLAQHGDQAGAERAAYVMMRDRVFGGIIAD